jgi:hypothetical protein
MIGSLISALNGSPAQMVKISELSAAVASGRYHVDAYLVSGSIIEHCMKFGETGYWAFST